MKLSKLIGFAAASWSFATAKLKAMRIGLYSLILIAVIGFGFLGCEEPEVLKIPEAPVVPTIPALTGTVTITGNAQVGQTLTANTSALGGSGVITFQWMRGGNAVIGSGSTYTVQNADVGFTINVIVIRSDNSGSVISASTAVVTMPSDPVTSDFNIENLTHTVGNVTPVTITPKAGKTTGEITIYYDGSTTLPTAVGTYIITFDVTGVLGWKAATGLDGGTFTINEKVNAQAPIINVQPVGTTVTFNASHNLEVSADSPDGGTLTYQWYSNRSASNSGGTVITGATLSTYNPSTGTAGTFYYFVEVTNTIPNNGDGGTKTATTRSNAAVVNVIDIDIEMMWIPGGTYTRGSSNGLDFGANPPHQVTLSQGFYMGKYQVTQEQYQAVMGSNPSWFSSSPAVGEEQGRRPVEGVSWYDALVFCNRLSIAEGLSPAYRINGSTNPNDWGTVPTSSNVTWDAVQIVSGSTGYRLPTEAQWEYACRAGTTTAYNTGNTISDSTGWYSANSSSRTREVGLKPANAWGLHDMHGNVLEWCWDWFGSYLSGAQIDPTGAPSGPLRVLRGGCWLSIEQDLRSANRYGYNPYYRFINYGFRLVCP